MNLETDEYAADICLRAGEPLFTDPDYWTWNNGQNAKEFSAWFSSLGR